MQRSQFLIRELQPADWKIFKELRILAVSTEPTAFLATAEEIKNLNDEYWKTFAQKFGQTLHVFFVFDSESGTAIGKIGLSPQHNQKNKHVAQVYYTYVMPEYRHRGIAEELMESLIVKARELKLELITLDLYDSQTAAFKLYKKFGFIEYGRISNFFNVTTDDGTVSKIGKIEMFKTL